MVGAGAGAAGAIVAPAIPVTFSTSVLATNPATQALVQCAANANNVGFVFALRGSAN
jgi:hypothetical protein